MSGLICWDCLTERARCSFTCVNIRNTSTQQRSWVCGANLFKDAAYHSQAAARAMDLLLQECEKDASCHNAFSQIRADWQNVLAQLGREPARVQHSSDGKSAPVTVEIQRDIFAEKIRNWMYGQDKARKNSI